MHIDCRLTVDTNSCELIGAGHGVHVKCEEDHVRSVCAFDYLSFVMVTGQAR